jgi:hypothetical protein
MLLLAAALVLQDAPASAPAVRRGNATLTLDALPLDQAAAVRCAVAFATISSWQQTDDARAAGFADIAAAGGREFFVQVMARLMDDTGLSREDIVALTATAAQENEGKGGADRLKAMLPACQLLKSASGL